MDSREDQPTAQIERVVIDVVIRLAFLGLLAYWVGVLVAPFVVIVIWAAILAVALSPLYSWLSRRFGGRGWLAAGLITVLLLGAVLGPVAVLVTSMVESAQTLLLELEDGTLEIPPPSESVTKWPLVGERLHDLWSEAYENLSSFLSHHSETVTGVAAGFLSTAAGIGGGVLGFAASIIIAAFLYGRGGTIAHGLGSFADRIVADRGHEFVAMSGNTIRNVANGVVGISFVQALLLGIGMIVAGVPAAGILTLLVFILTVVQIGPMPILLPVVIWAWSALDPLAAIAFTVYTLVVGLGDGAIKPVVMSRGLKTPMLVIFVGVIGGTLAHGMIGLFLGPIVLAVFYDLLKAWMTAGPPDGPATDRDPA